MISLENVRLRFDSRGIAGLSGISFALAEGSISALMGPNGSGKTTILKVLAGELVPHEGSYSLEQEAILVRTPEVPPELNVQKYLVSRVRSDIPCDKAIQLSRDLADIFEFTFQLRQKMGELSAGQRQKVLLAGEIINQPKLILLDEPFAHLDPHTRQGIIQSLFEYVKRQNVTLLWVTHDLNEAARFSDRIILLQHGKVEQEGTPESLVRKPRNLFVAKFMGYENFIPVKKSSSGKWTTPWGETEFRNAPESDEGYLVVPDTAWALEKESPVKVRIEETYYSETMWTALGQSEDRNFRIKNVQSLGDKGARLSLKPHLTDCFVIGL